MRFLVAFAGIVLSLPFAVFFRVGSRTFLRAGEKAFAALMLAGALALLGLSVSALFAPSLARANLIGVVAGLVAYGGLGIYAKRRRGLPPS